MRVLIVNTLYPPADIGGAELMGRGPAVTPGWLPGGYELAAVTIRNKAPRGQRTTHGGTNPLEAGAYVVEFIQKMLKHQASGVNLKLLTGE